MKKNLLLFIIAAILTAAASCLFAQSGQKIISAELKRQLSARYSQTEIDALESYASGEALKGLPASFFAARISEAASKRVSYSSLMSVLRKKTEFLKKGLNAVNSLSAQGRKTVRQEACVVLAGELFEKGLSEKDLQLFSDNAGKERAADDVLESAEYFTSFKGAGYGAERARTLALTLQKAEPENAEKMAGYVIAYPCAKAEELVKESVEEGRRNGWLKDRLEAESKKETMKEVLDDKRPER